MCKTEQFANRVIKTGHYEMVIINKNLKEAENECRHSVGNSDAGGDSGQCRDLGWEAAQNA